MPMRGLHRERGSRLAAILALLVSLGFGHLVAAQIEPFVIQDIRVEGLQRISPGSVFAALPVGVGDRVDTFAVRAAAKSLFASGNFDDISIARDGVSWLSLSLSDRASAKSRLTVIKPLRLKPCWTV